MQIETDYDRQEGSYVLQSLKRKKRSYLLKRRYIWLCCDYPNNYKSWVVLAKGKLCPLVRHLYILWAIINWVEITASV